MTLKDSPAWTALTQGTIEARSRSCTPVRTQPVHPRVRRGAAHHEVQREIAAGGRVEHASDTTAVLAHGAHLNHVLHLLSVFTFGLWLVVWVVLAATGALSRVMLHRRPLRQASRGRP